MVQGQLAGCGRDDPYRSSGARRRIGQRGLAKPAPEDGGASRSVADIDRARTAFFSHQPEFRTPLTRC